MGAHEVRPLVREMDERAKIPQGLIEGLFALGVMGIEIPEIGQIYEGTSNLQLQTIAKQLLG